MMTTKREVVEKMCGGKGHVIIDRILGEKELNGKCGLYAKVTINRDVLLAIMNITMRAKLISS